MVLRGCSKSFEFRPVSSTCAAVFRRDLLPEPTAAPYGMRLELHGSAWTGFAGGVSEVILNFGNFYMFAIVRLTRGEMKAMPSRNSCPHLPQK